MNPLLLIVEDDPATRKTMREIVAAADLPFLVAEDVAGGLRAVSAARPTFALIDILLPDGNGLEVAAAALARGCRVVVVSGFLADHDEALGRLAAQHPGRLDFLPKPFGAAELLARLPKKKAGAA